MNNYISLLSILTAFIIIPNYSQEKEKTPQQILFDLEGIREYKFGETFVSVLNKELKKQEYLLEATLTNRNRLVYRGILFNVPVKLIYLFREGRLVSLSYFWFLQDENNIFYRYLSRLLSTKYGEPMTQDIPSLQGMIHLDSYTKYTALYSPNGEVIPNPVLTIELETITMTNKIEPQNKAYILEFRAYDPDSIIQNKILYEDI